MPTLDRGSAAGRDSNLVFLDTGFLNWPPFLFSYALLFIEAFDLPIRRVSPTVAGCPELQDNHYSDIVIAFVLKMKFVTRRDDLFGDVITLQTRKPSSRASL